MIVRDKYKAPKPKPENIKGGLAVAKPRALLATPEGSRWSLVDWFKSTPDCLPGIQNMTQLKHDIEYECKANLTMNKLEEILQESFTVDIVCHLLGKTESNESDNNMSTSATGTLAWKFFMVTNLGMLSQKWWSERL